MTNKIAVFSVDDHAMMREGVASVINAQPDMCLVAQASTGNQAIEHFREYKADVTLMDLRLPDISGIEAMKVIRAEFPDARFIVSLVCLETTTKGYRTRGALPLSLFSTQGIQKPSTPITLLG